MSKLTKWSVIVGLLVLALLCYTFGFGLGIFALVILGVLFECFFWYQAFGRKKMRE